MNLKSPNLGPVLHAGAAALVALAWPTAEYLQSYFIQHATDPQWDFKAMFMGLAIALLGFVVSTYHNAGAVELKKDETLWVKGTQAGGGQAVIATASEVVPNNESVIVLRGRPRPPKDPRTVPADPTPGDVITAALDAEDPPRRRGHDDARGRR